MHQSDKHTFSLRQLAKKYGMTPSNIYHYFKSKEELMNEIFPYLYQRIVDEILYQLSKEERECLSAKEQLIRIAMTHIKIMKERPAYVYLILLYQKNEKEVRSAGVESYKIDWFYERVKDAIKETNIPRTASEEIFIFQQWVSMVNGIIFTWSGGIIDYTEKPEQFLENFLKNEIYPMLFETEYGC